jgi:hypothetical protein
LSSTTSGSSGSAAQSTHDTSQDQTVTLLNLLYANEGTPLHDLGHLLMRIEAPSHILVWTKVYLQQYCSIRISSYTMCYSSADNQAIFDAE